MKTNYRIIPKDIQCECVYGEIEIDETKVPSNNCELCNGTGKIEVFGVYDYSVELIPVFIEVLNTRKEAENFISSK